MRPRPDNALRFDPEGSDTHVESYFMRANHPTLPRSIWLKATVFAPRPGSAVADLWCIVFDGERERVWAAKRTTPFGRAKFDGEPMLIELAGAELLLGARGHAKGRLEGDRGPCEWDLTWEAVAGPMGSPLSLMPSDSLVDKPFPKSQTLTPTPVTRVFGTVDIWGETISLDGWLGMQGHNWGSEYSWEYAWGHCVFVDDDAQPTCVVEGVSTRLRVGGKTTPFFSSLMVRRGEAEYAFSNAFAVWRQEAHIGDLSWRLKTRSAAGEAVLEMSAEPRLMACLGYQNVDGRLAYCLNSKLGRARLRVNPTNEEGFECVSEHGAAFEVVSNTPDLRFDRVV